MRGQGPDSTHSTPEVDGSQVVKPCPAQKPRTGWPSKQRRQSRPPTPPVPLTEPPVPPLPPEPVVGHVPSATHSTPETLGSQTTYVEPGHGPSPTWPS